MTPACTPCRCPSSLCTVGSSCSLDPLFRPKTPPRLSGTFSRWGHLLSVVVTQPKSGPTPRLPSHLCSTTRPPVYRQNCRHTCVQRIVTPLFSPTRLPSGQRDLRSGSTRVRQDDTPGDWFAFGHWNGKGGSSSLVSFRCPSSSRCTCRPVHLGTPNHRR